MDCFIVMGCLKNVNVEEPNNEIYVFNDCWEKKSGVFSDGIYGAVANFTSLIKKYYKRNMGFVFFDTKHFDFNKMNVDTKVYIDILKVSKKALVGNRLAGIFFVTCKELFSKNEDIDVFKNTADTFLKQLATDIVGVQVPSIFIEYSDDQELPINKALCELAWGSGKYGLSSPITKDTNPLFYAFDLCQKRYNSSLFHEIDFEHSVSDVFKKLDKGENLTVQLVGDSITWGICHCTDNQTYAAELCKLLAADYPKANIVRFDGIAPAIETGPITDYTPVTVNKGENQKITVVRNGVGGDSVLRAMKRSFNFTGTAPDSSRPDLMILMFGVNDALISDPQKYVSPDVFKTNYQLLVREIYRTNPDTAVVLMTPTYNDFGDSHISCLDEYSIRVKEVANEFGLPFIDLHDVWMKHLQIGAENYGQGDWLSGAEGDTTHWSPESSKIMAYYIYNLLKQLGGSKS